jgi:hypothetical protein
VLFSRLDALARNDLGLGSHPERALLVHWRRAAIVACLLLGHWMHPPVARAQGDGRVLVVPLDSSVPDAQTEIVLALDQALTRSLQREAATVTVAQTSLDDAMAIVGCSERSAPCLSRVAEALAVDYIVFGSVSPSEEPGAFEIALVVARRDGDDQPSEVLLLVRAAGAAEVERAFVRAAPPSLLAPQAPSTTPAAPLADDAGAGQAFDVARVERSSWIVTGTGGALLSVGVVFWLLASSSQSDVDSLEIGSVTDLERLVALEDRTETRASIGNALVITGAMTAAVGAVMAVRQGMTRKQPARIDLAPTATATSVGFTLTIDWSP